MLHHDTEVVDDSAMLYLRGDLCAADAPTLNRACAALPERVRTLRLGRREHPVAPTSALGELG